MSQRSDRYLLTTLLLVDQLVFSPTLTTSLTNYMYIISSLNYHISRKVWQIWRIIHDSPTKICNYMAETIHITLYG